MEQFTIIYSKFYDGTLRNGTMQIVTKHSTINKTRYWYFTNCIRINIVCVESLKRTAWKWQKPFWEHIVIVGGKYMCKKFEWYFYLYIYAYIEAKIWFIEFTKLKSLITLEPWLSIFLPDIALYHGKFKDNVFDKEITMNITINMIRKLSCSYFLRNHNVSI